MLAAAAVWCNERHTAMLLPSPSLPRNILMTLGTNAPRDIVVNLLCLYSLCNILIQCINCCARCHPLSLPVGPWLHVNYRALNNASLLGL